MTIVEDHHGGVLDVGRRTRRPNRRLLRALHHRDRGCRFPGCAATRTDAHHVRHWLDGGPTSLANLISLCSRHHHLHHDGLYDILPVAGDGWRFVRADGQPIPAVTALPALPAWAGPPDPGCDAADTVTPDWDGDTLRHDDLSSALDGLLRREGLVTATVEIPDDQTDDYPYLPAGYLAYADSP